MKYLAISFLAFALACQPSKRSDKTSRVVTIDSSFNELFSPQGNAFTGGDGVYSVQLPDQRNVWIFGDSFLGNVTEDRKRIKTSPLYVRNCFVVQDEENLKTLTQGKLSDFKSMMIPPEVVDGTSGKDEIGIWYWPGDAFVEEQSLFVFNSKFIKTADDMWGFEFAGTELIEFSLPDLEQTKITQFENLNGIHFGHAICNTADYTYVYGAKDKLPYVARAKSGAIYEDWNFWNGAEWEVSSKDAKPILKQTGSEQFSVFEWAGQFVMIMQGDSLSQKIYSYTAEKPEGPWLNRKIIYETPIVGNCESCWTYNALGHPQFIINDMLLVSYNTNSMELQDHYDNADIYKPRFIRVPMENILDSKSR
ncbi:MAG: hypothetical protein ACI83W_000806 [Marinoscillum sp.]|jgi:hypothetical protein